MAIHSAEDLNRGRPKIDLTGPEGNAFVLIGYAKSWGKSLGMDSEEISRMVEDMKSSDYEHLLDVLELHFGELVDFYR